MPPRKPGPPPRDWLIDADARERWGRTGFGEADDPGAGWKDSDDPQEQALVKAAMNQNRLSIQAREWMRRGQLSTEEVAEAVGMSADLLRDILNGRAHVYLTDLHRIGAVIGWDFLSTYEDPSVKRRQEARKSD